MAKASGLQRGDAAAFCRYLVILNRSPICELLGNASLQYSCLENPMDGGPWWAAVHGVAKSQTRLSDFTFTFHFHTMEKEMASLMSFKSILAFLSLLLKEQVVIH